MTDVSPEEAKKVWESLSHPSARGVHRALTAAGRKVSLQTICNWRKAGWSRRPNDVPSPRDVLEQLVPAVTGKLGATLDEFVAARSAHLAGLSAAELEDLAAQTALRTEIVAAEYLQANVSKMDQKIVPDWVAAGARMRAANRDSSERIAKQAGEAAKVVQGRILPSGMREDDPLAAAIAGLGRVNP